MVQITINAKLIDAQQCQFIANCALKGHRDAEHLKGPNLILC